MVYLHITNTSFLKLIPLLSHYRIYLNIDATVTNHWSTDTIFHFHLCHLTLQNRPLGAVPPNQRRRTIKRHVSYSTQDGVDVCISSRTCQAKTTSDIIAEQQRQIHVNYCFQNRFTNHQIFSLSWLILTNLRKQRCGVIYSHSYPK